MTGPSPRAADYFREKEACHTMKGKDFLTGVLVGSIVGAAIGLLMAPQSGEETREVLGEQARNIRDKVQESSRQVVESSRDLYEQGKAKISAVMPRGRDGEQSGGAEQA